MTESLWMLIVALMVGLPSIVAALRANKAALEATSAANTALEIKHMVNSEREAMRREISDLKSAIQTAAVEAARQAVQINKQEH